MPDRRSHWETVHTNRDPLTVSWHQEDPSLSLELIRAVDPDRSIHVADIGGGSSRVVDGLIGSGYTDVTVLDISSTALDRSRTRLGDVAHEIEWVDADILDYEFDRPVDVWHDRAVFHFFTSEADRRSYVAVAETAMTRGGHVIIAAFAPDGPEQCSGLPVQRYSPESMASTLGNRFEPVRFEHEAHRTPAGAIQHFLYGVFSFL